MTNKVGDRFQITIDKKVRRQLAIRPGDLAVERAEDGRLVVEFIRRHPESMLGWAKRHATRAVEPITDWDAMKDRVWAVRAAEIREVLEEDSRRHRGGR